MTAEELKQEIGLDHFEGRGWRGFHHHATLCIAAYGFLISEQETIPPSGPHSSALFQTSRLRAHYRPRRPPAQNRASYPELDRDHAPTIGRSYSQPPVSMSVLCTDDQTNPDITEFVTQ